MEKIVTKRRIRKSGTCVGCNSTKPIVGKGNCQACYAKIRRAEGITYVPVPRKCVVCCVVKDIHANGKCNPCYRRDKHRANGAIPRKIKGETLVCNYCNEESESVSKRAMKCVSCYKIERKEEDKLSKKKWKENNRAKVAADSRGRAIKNKKATLPDTNFDEMEQIYKKAHELSVTTGIKHQVDHIIPLRHKDVCGLNCPQNLQVITAEENYKKNNKFDYTNDNLSWKNEFIKK